MKRVDAVLSGLFWLPILLGGVVGFAFIEPKFRLCGIVAGALLGLFLLILLFQVISERRSLDAPRRAAIAMSKPPPPDLQFGKDET
jgi:hypothetical protein